MKAKVVLGTILIALFVLGMTGTSFGETEKTYTYGDKLYRGAMNIATFPMEIPNEIHGTTHDKSLLEGWTVGLVKGLKEGTVRLGAGAVDLITFPLNYPDKDKAPLVKPEYAWDKPGLKYV